MIFDKKKLWYIHGQAYDLTNFLPQHPGGRDPLMMAQGLNCTELFETYHFKNRPSDELLKKYRVKVDMSEYTSEEKEELLAERFLFEEKGFFNTMKQRVREHFESKKNYDIKGGFGWKLAGIIECFLLVAVMPYMVFVVGDYYWAFAYGFLKGFTAITSGHALSHFSLFYGSNNTRIFKYVAPFVLSNVQIWSTSHIISHHILTLTPKDLQDNYPLKRVQLALPYKPWHRFQHFYIWPVYMLGLPLWTTVDLVATIPTLFTGKHEMRKFNMLQRIENFIQFAFNVGLTILLPFYAMEFYHALSIFLITSVISSLLVVVQISVNHEVPDTMSKIPEGKIDWGIHQVITSHNYGVDSLLALHMSGGLNMQIEHHLFPGIHYRFYQEIAPIVKKTCEEYGLPYNTSSNIFEAVYKHYQALKIGSSP